MPSAGALAGQSIVTSRWPSNENVTGSKATRKAPERRSRYQLHLPYTILLRLGWGAEKGMVYFFASQPVDEDRCVGYVTMARNYDREQPDSVLQRVGLHSERGPLTLERMLVLATNHIPHHVKFIAEKRQALGV